MNLDQIVARGIQLAISATEALNVQHTLYSTQRLRNPRFPPSSALFPTAAALPRCLELFRSARPCMITICRDPSDPTVITVHLYPESILRARGVQDPIAWIREHPALAAHLFKSLLCREITANQLTDLRASFTAHYISHYEDGLSWSQVANCMSSGRTLSHSVELVHTQDSISMTIDSSPSSTS